MIKFIESRQNSTYKRLLKLKTKKGRTQAGQYIVDGLRIVNHAIEHKISIDCIVMSKTFSHQSDLIESDHATYVVSDDLFKELVETESPQGIMAVVYQSTLPLGSGKLLFLDGIQDPGNIGTLIRTAEAAGFTGVILRKGCTDPYSQKALRSSMGSVMSIPILLNQHIEILEKLKQPIFGAALEGGKSFRVYDYPENAILIIGNEGNGISEEVLKLCDERVYIPMIGDVESLNASIAGGILMFEMQKTCT